MFEEQASEENDDEEWAGNYLDTPQHRKKNASRLKAARRITSGDDEKNLLRPFCSGSEEKPKGETSAVLYYVIGIMGILQYTQG